MSRHQIRLLLCAAAAVALIVGATFVIEWFWIDVAGTRMTIGLRSGTVCIADGTCPTIGMDGTGTYRVLAEGAFWNALVLALLVIAHAGTTLFGGAASMLASRIGYAVGAIAILCALGAGFLFAPETPRALAELSLAVARPLAPVMLVAGCLLGILAIRYAHAEPASDEAAEYKPIVVDKRDANARGPATASQQIERVAVPGDRARSPSDPGRGRAPTDPGRSRTTSQQVERIAPSGDRARPPSEPGRSRTTSQEFERTAVQGDRTRSPSQPGRARASSERGSMRAPSEPGLARSASGPVDAIELPDAEVPSQRTRSPLRPLRIDVSDLDDSGDPLRTSQHARKPSSHPPLVARTASPQQPQIARTASPQQPQIARTASPQQPQIARTASPQQPLLARTASPQQPLLARTASPQQPLLARTASPAHGVHRLDDGQGVPSRAHTSSSGPIDLAARLSAAPSAVAIKPPLPEPVPVPPDQIPVAPESGLVIRKRTPSSGPLAAHQLATAGAASTGSSASTASAPATHDPDHIAVAPESGLVIRKRPTAPDLSPPPAFGIGEAVRAHSGITPPGAMPSIALRNLDPDIDNPLAPPAQSQLPAPAKEPAIPRAFTPADKPLALRGKLKYAVNMATLTSLGITAQREDGTTKHVGWDDIIGIIARRLPAEAPYEGATFVDLVSTSGSTLRVLPWTRLDGAPVRGEGEERARAFVQLIAARCLDAKLDSWTKVFADGAGHAAQLPSANTLAAHDDKLA